MRSVAVVALLAGCSAIYNADYDDREAALAQSRTTVLPATDNVSFVTTGDNRLYWIDNEQAAETTVLHSIDTSNDNKQIDYQFAKDDSGLQSDVGLGQDLVVLCQETEAFDASSSSMTAIAELSDEDEDEIDNHCAVSGSDVYLIDGQQLVKWHPDASAGSNQSVTTVVDLMALNVNTSSITGLAGADSTHIVYGEGNNLWLLAPGGASGSASLLNAANPITSGIVALDSEGVVYPTGEGSPLYAKFSDPMHPTPVSDLIANGGYDLLGNGDIQDLNPQASYTIADGHLVYEANGGIFALGLDSGNVVDILLDGRTDSDGEPTPPQYQLPAVTTSDLMFVQDMSSFDADADNQAVFRVDLTGRLK